MQSRLYDIISRQIKVKKKYSSDKDSLENPGQGIRADCSEYLGLDGLACLLSLGCTALFITNKLLTLSSPPYTQNRSFKDELELSPLKSRWSIHQAMSVLLKLLLSKEKSLNPLDFYQNPMLQKSVPSFQNLSLLARKL